jgi:hypothetical protein
VLSPTPSPRSTARAAGSQGSPQAPPAPAGPGSTGPVEASDDANALRVLRYLDLGALALALPVFLVAGFSMLGYVVAAVAWVVQRIVRELVQRRAQAATDVRTSVGLTAASMIIRGWLVAFAIFGVGLRDSEAGLAAAILFLFLFTLYSTMQAILRPFDAPPRPREPAP